VRQPSPLQALHQVLTRQHSHLFTQFTPTPKLDIQHHAADLILIFTQSHKAIPRQIHPVTSVAPTGRIIGGNFAQGNADAAAWAIWNGVREINPRASQPNPQGLTHLTQPCGGSTVMIGPRDGWNDWGLIGVRTMWRHRHIVLVFGRPDKRA
jgi:hypothetical protein